MTMWLLKNNTTEENTLVFSEGDYRSLIATGNYTVVESW